MKKISRLQILCKVISKQGKLENKYFLSAVKIINIAYKFLLSLVRAIARTRDVIFLRTCDTFRKDSEKT